MEITIVFSGPYSLDAQFGHRSDDAELKAVVLAVVAARLRELAKGQPDRVKEPQGQPTITITTDSPDASGPVRITCSGLGCPRDQMLVVAEWLTTKCQFVWFQQEARGLQEQQLKAKAKGQIVLPQNIDFGKLRAN